MPRVAEHMTLFIPVARDRALLRTLLRGLGAILCALPVRYVVPRLRFSPSGISNRIEDYALAFVMLVLAILAVWLACSAIRWLALGLWPGRIGFTFDDVGVALRLGPFGRRRLEAAGFDTRYLYEMDEAERGQSVEAFLPPPVQHRTLVPPLRHRDIPQPLRTLLLDMAAGEEEELAERLAPVICLWRSRAASTP